MKDFIFGNWRILLGTAGVAALIGFGGGYKVGAWITYPIAKAAGIEAQKLEQAKDALKATQNAISSRNDTDHEISKIKDPDIIKLLRDRGELRRQDDL